MQIVVNVYNCTFFACHNNRLEITNDSFQ